MLKRLKSVSMLLFLMGVVLKELRKRNYLIFNKL